MPGSLNSKGAAVARSSITRLEKLVFILCALLIIIRLIASFFPQLRLWGINQLHYFPVGFRLVLCAAGLMVLIPRANDILAGFLTKAFMRVAGRLKKVNPYLGYSVVGILSLIVFWLLRAATPLLGDGYLRAGELKLGALFEITEPLDFYLHLLVYRWLGMDGYAAYAVVSCMAGGAFVFLAFLFCDLWGKDGREKLLIFSMLVTMGSMQLFFGYVESYSLMYVSLAAYLLFGLRYLKGRSGFIWPCLFLLLAGGFHLSALFALPSLFYLAFARSSDASEGGSTGFKFAHGMYLAGMVFLVALGLYLLKTYAVQEPPGSVLIHPFGRGESLYSFFSPAHLLDFVNHQLLISPVGAALLVGLAVFFRKAIAFKDSSLKFLLCFLLCLLAFALLVDPKLGYARDWDLFASAGLSVTLLGSYLLLRLAKRENAEELGRITLALVVTAAISTGPWILVNAAEQKATARFEDLLNMDEQRAAHGYEILACYYRDNDAHERTVDLWKKAIAANPNPRYFASLGNAYRRLEENDKAIEAYYRSLEAGADLASQPGLHSNLGNTLGRMGRYEEAISHMKKAISLRPDKADYYFNLGNILGMAGRYKEAAPYFETSIRLNPGNTRALKLLGITYARMGEKEKAKTYLEQYLRKVPKDAPQLEGIIDSIQIEIEYGR